MNTNIAKAFVAAQKDFSPALKDSNNPFFKSKYADLSTCIKAVIDALHKNDIALIQVCSESETGVIVETSFLHESGEILNCGKLHVPAAKNDPQGYGSALTYARRYSLMAACGIAPEDDDGNAASKPAPAVKLLTLTAQEGEREYNKWMEVKSLLLDKDGDVDNERVANEWGKLQSNVRTAIKKHGESLKTTDSINSEADKHIQSIKD